jgi:uncharacterized membrane protein YgcG
MADTPRYTGVTYEQDYFRQPDESMYDFMMRLAKLRATGVLGGGGMLDTPTETVSIEEVPTQTAPAVAANLGMVQTNTGSSDSGTQRRVSSGQPILDKNGNPVLDSSGNPVMGTMVVNEPKKETTYRDSINIAGGNSLMPSDVTGKAGPVGQLVGMGMDYLVERDAISKAAEYLGVTEDDVLTMAALDDTSAVKAALDNGMLGFKPNTEASVGMKIAKAALNPMSAAMDFGKDLLFGNKDITEYKMEDQLNAAIMEEAANRAGMFSGVMKGMTSPLSNIVDRNPITGAGVATFNGQNLSYSPGLLSNVDVTPVVSTVFNPALNAGVATTGGALNVTGLNYDAVPSAASPTGFVTVYNPTQWSGGDVTSTPAVTTSGTPDWYTAATGQSWDSSPSSSGGNSSSGGGYTGGGSSYGGNPSSTVSGGSGRTDGGYGW